MFFRSLFERNNTAFYYQKIPIIAAAETKYQIWTTQHSMKFVLETLKEEVWKNLIQNSNKSYFIHQKAIRC